jgi:class 3 adenylate cyclase
MGLADDLKEEVKGIFSETWEVSEAQVVPDPESLKLSNDARHFERATILYADLSGSTNLVDKYHWKKAGKIYKSYLACAARIIRSLGGEITAYDGDRVMAVFIGDMQTTNAAKCALKINWAVKKIVNPALKDQYENPPVVKQVVGIDCSEIRAARIGIRGGNDLVWIGRAANYAAKLTEIRNGYSSWITYQAYARLAESAKMGGESGEPKRAMWKRFRWTAMNNVNVYGSNWTWALG